MREIWAMAIVASMFAAGSASADEKCPFRPVPAAVMPGLKLDSMYQDVKAQVPQSARCDDWDDDDRLNCSFIDRHGYELVFSDITSAFGREGPDRLHYLKVATRARGGKLPFGVLWSDNEAQVLKRIRAFGAKPSLALKGGRRTVAVLGCFAPGDGDPYSTSFIFGAGGSLERVQQSVVWP